jgi:hypothetical protein
MDPPVNAYTPAELPERLLYKVRIRHYQDPHRDGVKFIVVGKSNEEVYDVVREVAGWDLVEGRDTDARAKTIEARGNYAPFDGLMSTTWHWDEGIPVSDAEIQTVKRLGFVVATPIHFVSGHLDLTDAEFHDHYRSKLLAAIYMRCTFVVGDAKGTDTMAQKFLAQHRYDNEILVYHMLKKPRYKAKGLHSRGGFKSDEERDRQMTCDSHYDIAWVRPGREKSGTADNLARRTRL